MILDHLASLNLTELARQERRKRNPLLIDSCLYKYELRSHYTNIDGF
jgi:hypothetical protein